MLTLLADMLTALVECRKTAELIWLSRGGEEVSAELCELRDKLDELIRMLKTANKCLAGKP